jgi:hypothetical protein
MSKQAPASAEFCNRSKQADQLVVLLSHGHWQCADAEARLHRLQQTKNAVVAPDDRRVWRDVAQPVFAHGFVKTDERDWDSTATCNYRRMLRR